MTSKYEPIGIDVVDALKLDGQASRPSEAKAVEKFASTVVVDFAKKWGAFMSNETLVDSKFFPYSIIWTKNNQLATIFDEFDPENQVEPVAEGEVNKLLCFEECGARWYSRSVLMGKALDHYSNPSEDLKIDFYQRLVERRGDNVHRLFFGTLDNVETQKAILGDINREKVEELFGKDYMDMYGEITRYDPDVFGVTFGQKRLVVMKSATRALNKLIKHGHIDFPEDDIGREKLKKRWLSALDNTFLVHEYAHLFFASGHRDEATRKSGEE